MQRVATQLQSRELIGSDTLILLGYSGGLDSSVLLAQLVKIRQSQSGAKLNLQALHVNHHLQIAATDFENHCQQQCKKFEVALKIVAVDARPAYRQSPEQAAREARYAAFAEHAREALQNPAIKKVVLVCAHHRDDQAETFLLQLMRGAGAKGLSAMPLLRELAPNYFQLRPLLNHSRAELERYANEQHIAYIEDPSNRSLEYERNFLRHKLMPILNARYAQASKNIARSCTLIAEQNQLIERMAATICADYLGQTKLPISPLLSLDTLMQKLWLRTWLASLNATMPSAAIMRELIQLLHSQTGEQAWGVGEKRVYLRRYQQDLYFYPQHFLTQLNQIELGKTHEFVGDAINIQGFGVIKRSTLPPAYRQQNLTIQFIGNPSISMQDRVYLNSRPHSVSLKNYCQQAGIAPWLRKFCALILQDARIRTVIKP